MTGLPRGDVPQHSWRDQAPRSSQPARGWRPLSGGPGSLMPPWQRLVLPAGTGAPIAPHAASVASCMRSSRGAGDAGTGRLREAARKDGAGISHAESARPYERVKRPISGRSAGDSDRHSSQARQPLADSARRPACWQRRTPTCSGRCAFCCERVKRPRPGGSRTVTKTLRADLPGGSRACAAMPRCHGGRPGSPRAPQRAPAWTSRPARLACRKAGRRPVSARSRPARPGVCRRRIVTGGGPSAGRPCRGLGPSPGRRCRGPGPSPGRRSRGPGPSPGRPRDGTGPSPRRPCGGREPPLG